MKTIHLVIICATILLLTFGISFFIWSENIYETPYEQCLELCEYSSKIDCVNYCNEDFKEAIEIIVNKLAPVLETAIKQECLG